MPSRSSIIVRRNTSSSPAIFSTLRNGSSSTCSVLWTMTEAMPDKSTANWSRRRDAIVSTAAQLQALARQPSDDDEYRRVESAVAIEAGQSGQPRDEQG